MKLDSKVWLLIAGRSAILLLTLSGCTSAVQTPNPLREKKTEAYVETEKTQEETPKARKEKANALLNEAVPLLTAGKYAEACPKLEKATDLVPSGIGAKLALGECYEGELRLFSACRQYLDAASLAKSQQDNQRAKEAEEACNKLHPRLPHVKLVVPTVLTSFTGWSITVDGRWNVVLSAVLDNLRHAHETRLFVDHGLHFLEIRVNERVAWKHEFIVENGETLEVLVPWLPIFGQTPFQGSGDIVIEVPTPPRDDDSVPPAP